jgi:asparagine synthase (glutamine-hydrolysing)
MCGIVGTIGNVPMKSVLTEALRGLHHRGPDSAGEARLLCRGNDIWLGHARLAILDLTEAGHQPMRSQDGRWWVNFNGEIYNHGDLRKELNVTWRGHSDTETLVEALATWGLSTTLARLNGMFAFAAVDMESGKAYLGRDPFGIKPLYYARTEQCFCFSSEIKALVKITGRRYSVDPDALQTFLSLRFVPSPYTLLDGIQRVPAGHFLTIDVKSKVTELQRYIEPETRRFRGSLDDAVDEYHGLMVQAVKRNMLSDVPVGVFLSGGVDSAYIAALAAKQTSGTPCYAIGYGAGFPECELNDAERCANLLGLKFNPLLVTQDELWSVFEASIASIEEPLGTTSVLPMWALSQYTRKQVKVVLTGQGSDEPWGGYRRYQAELWRNIPFVSLMARLAMPVLERLPRVPEYISRALDGMPVSDMGSRFEREYSLFSGSQRAALTGNKDHGRAVDAINYWLDWSANQSDADGAERMMTIDSRMGLADDLLLYGDKISMAHSLETRVPMLDIDLVRFIETLPRSYRVTLRQAKIVHKLAARKCLPDGMVYQKKKAFPMPFSKWIRTVWRERVENILFQDGAPHLQWMSIAAIRATWDEHQQGVRDRGRQLFALLAFAFWCRTMAGCLNTQAAVPSHSRL